MAITTKKQTQSYSPDRLMFSLLPHLPRAKVKTLTTAPRLRGITHTQRGPLGKQQEGVISHLHTEHKRSFLCKPDNFPLFSSLTQHTPLAPPHARYSKHTVTLIMKKGPQLQFQLQLYFCSTFKNIHG